MDFLIRAEKYCEDRGDDLLFKSMYLGYRDRHSVRSSVWYTLSTLYSSKVADELGQGSLTK